MRLVDADDFIKKLALAPMIQEAMRKAFNQMPTVEVIRCKDCKWWKTNYSWNGNEHKICVREAYEPLRNAEDFCSRGERREDERK